MDKNTLHPFVRMALAKRDELQRRERLAQEHHAQMQVAISRHADSINELSQARGELAALEDALNGEQRSELVQAFLARDEESKALANQIINYGPNPWQTTVELGLAGLGGALNGSHSHPVYDPGHHSRNFGNGGV